MSGFDQMLLLLQGIGIWGVAKLLVVVAIGLYVVFAVVVIRQVQLMSETLKGVLVLPIKLLAYMHLAVAVGVLVMAVVIL